MQGNNQIASLTGSPLGHYIKSIRIHYFRPLFLHMLKVLWLCSWYPNEEDRFTGDFIQRQARAVSQFASLDVFHIVESYEGRKGLHSSEYNDQLREHIQYLPCDRLSKPSRLIHYFRAHQQFLSSYIAQHGAPDLIHVQIPMKAGLFAWYAKKRLQIPYIVTEHYGIYSTLAEDHFFKRSFLFRYFTKLILLNAKFLTTVSFSLGKEINDAGIRKRFKVVPNVVDTTLFKPSYIKNNSTFRFVHVSNMAQVKNVRGMIMAAKQLSETGKKFELHFIGAEPDEYVSLAEELNLLNRQVFFKKEIPYNEVAEEIRRSHAMIIFSDTESQSCVAIEALCSGKPVIVTQTGGVKELIDEHNGLQVKPRDEKALFKAMDKMINEYGNYDVNKIVSKASARYSYEAVGQKFLKIYERTIRRKSQKSEEEIEPDTEQDL